MLFSYAPSDMNASNPLATLLLSSTYKDGKIFKERDYLSSSRHVYFTTFPHSNSSIFILQPRYSTIPYNAHLRNLLPSPLGAFAASVLEARGAPGSPVYLLPQYRIIAKDIELNIENGQLSSATLNVEIQDLITGPLSSTTGTCSSIPIQDVTGTPETPVFSIPANAPFMPCSPSTVEIQLSGSNEALSVTISHAVNGAILGVVQRLATFSTGLISTWTKIPQPGNGVRFMAPIASLSDLTSQNIQAPAGWTGDQIAFALPVDPNEPGVFVTPSYQMGPAKTPQILFQNGQCQP
jgi:hypothetical protein